ncbi:MoaD/ThiS family protein [Elusimicrobiota bacterium]
MKRSKTVQKKKQVKIPVITARFYAGLKNLVNAAGIRLKGKNVGEALEDMRSKIKPLQEKEIFDDTRLIKSHFRIALNQKILDNAKDLKVRVRNGDIIHIFPPAKGG